VSHFIFLPSSPDKKYGIDPTGYQPRAKRLREGTVGVGAGASSSLLSSTAQVGAAVAALEEDEGVDDVDDDGGDGQG
jgi:hypothetical protein